MYADDEGCTDETCEDEPDYWGSEGFSDVIDSWDSFDENGDWTTNTMYADTHDDRGYCDVGSNCTLRSPHSDESTAIQNEIQRLLLMTSLPFCQQVAQAAQKWMQDNGTNSIQFFDNYVRTKKDDGSWGYLGGDIHPQNWTDDPYHGQIHIYGGVRSMSAILQSFRHEAAHAWGLPDGPPSSGTNPMEFNGEQASTYCQ
jgi:hypothetical protein